MKLVCPLPASWAAVYTVLTRAWEESGREGGREGPPPPVPLILAGWIATNDLEKAQRWQETVTWARDRDLERILADLREQDKYCVEEFTTYEVGPFGGPMYLTWNFDAKPVPDARSVQMAMAILLKEWPTHCWLGSRQDDQTARVHRKKKRRLVVKADAEQVPPWGSWNCLAPGEDRRAFTRRRSAINQAISPLKVDHIYFERVAGWAGLRENDGE